MTTTIPRIEIRIIEELLLWNGWNILLIHVIEVHRYPDDCDTPIPRIEIRIIEELLLWMEYFIDLGIVKLL